MSLLKTSLLLSVPALLLTACAGKSGGAASDSLLTPDGATVSVKLVGKGDAGSMNLHGGGRKAEFKSAKWKEEIHIHHHHHDDDSHEDDEGSEGKNKIIVGGESARSEEDFEKCATAFGVKKDKIAVVGRHSRLELDTSQVLFLKVQGHKSKIKINVEREGDAATEVAGICIIEHGSKNSIEINVDATLKNLYHKIRGEKNLTVVDVGKDGGLLAGSLDVSGSKNTIMFTGTGKLECEKIEAVVQGEKESLKCEK